MILGGSRSFPLSMATCISTTVFGAFTILSTLHIAHCILFRFRAIPRRLDVKMAVLVANPSTGWGHPPLKLSIHIASAFIGTQTESIKGMMLGMLIVSKAKEKYARRPVRRM